MRAKARLGASPGPFMSSPDATFDAGSLVDAFALAMQELHSRKNLNTAQPLIRIDPRVEAARAPFLFDSALAVLHCNGCKEIPASSRSALYAVWQIGRKDLEYACKKCRPMPNKNKPERSADAGDILLGLLSLVDQFGSILSQRGQDFRRTERGRQVEHSLSGLLEELSLTQREGVNLLTSAVDRLLSTVNRYNHSTNGSHNHNGKGRPQRRKGGLKKKNSTRPARPSKSNLSVGN
jgi:hypothetical protein